MSGDIVKRLWHTSAYLRTMEETDIREAIEDAADAIERMEPEIERLRAAGDALADACVPSLRALAAWEEARRD